MNTTLSIVLGFALALYCAGGALYSFLILLGGKDRNVPWLLVCGPVGWMTLTYLLTRNLVLTVILWILASGGVIYWLAHR